MMDTLFQFNKFSGKNATQPRKGRGRGQHKRGAHILKLLFEILRQRRYNLTKFFNICLIEEFAESY